MKIQDAEKEPTGREVLLSTDDKAFNNGKVGEYIRKMFPEGCRYETRGQ